MGSPSDPSSPGQGQLFVTGPHITAELAVLNHRREPVGRGVGALEPLTLPPGLYDVQATVGGATAYHMVKLALGGIARISKEDWDAQEVRFSSAAPLAGTATTHEWQRDPAMEWSRRPTWKPPRTGGRVDSRLFVFVRTLKPKKYQKYFAKELDLLDCDGRLLVRLEGKAVRTKSSKGWMAFCADLPAGPYLLYRRPGREVRARYQPLYLCAGWETQVFVPSGQQPSLRRLSLIYARLGEGFMPDDAQDEAAEAVLVGLRRGLNLATGEQMRNLLEYKLDKPWLGVLAAHAMRLPRPDDKSEYGAVRDLAHAPTYRQGNADLYRKVVDRVAKLLGDHPDVRALRLPLSQETAGGGPHPFPFPPLLQASLALTRQSEAGLGAELIPADSLTDCLLERLYSNSVWTGWGALSRTPRPLAEVKESTVAAVGADAMDDADATASLRGMGARRLTKRAAARKPQDDPTVADALAFVALHRVHLHSVSSPMAPADALTVALAVWAVKDQEGSAPAEPRVESAFELAALVGDQDIDDLCNTYGLPRARALQVVEHLRTDGSTFIADLLDRPIGALTTDEQAVVDTLKRRLGSDSLDASAALDSLIQQIGAALGQLAGLQDEDWTAAVRADLAAGRRRLARRAVLLTVTDTKDEAPLYENPPFAALFHRGTEVPGAWRRLRPGTVKAVPTSLVRDKEADAAGVRATYRVSRTAVADKPAGHALAWIYHATPPKQPWDLEELTAWQKHATCILTSLDLLDYQTSRNPERTEEYRRQIVDAARHLR